MTNLKEAQDINLDFSFTWPSKYVNLSEFEKEDITNRFVQFAQLLREFCEQYERDWQLESRLRKLLLKQHWMYAEGLLEQEDLITIFEDEVRWMKPLWRKTAYRNCDSLHRLERDVEEVFDLKNARSRTERNLTDENS